MKIPSTIDYRLLKAFQWYQEYFYLVSNHRDLQCDEKQKELFFSIKYYFQLSEHIWDN